MTENEFLKNVSTALEKDDEESAFRQCDEFISSNSDSPLGFRKRAFLYARQGNFNNAVADIDRALLLNSDEPSYYFFRGWWRLEINDLSGAIDDQSRVIAMEDKAPAKLYSESAFFFRSYARLQAREYKLSLSDIGKVSNDFLIHLRSAGEITKSEIVKQATEQGRDINNHHSE